MYSPVRSLALAMLLQAALMPVARAELAAAGGAVLTDQPGTPRTLRDVGQPSSDSSLLLDDSSGQSLETILRERSLKVERPIFVLSPLQNVAGRTYGLVTAEHLRTGELVQTQLVRLFIPERGVNDDLYANQSNQTIWGLSDDIELTLDLQGVNGSVPGIQGPFAVERRVGVNNGNLFQDFSLLGKVRLGTIFGGQTSVVAGLTASRPQFTFRLGNVIVEERRQDGTVLTPSLEVPLTFKSYDGRYAFTVSPKFVWFPEDSNLYTPVNPFFGGSFGFTAAVAFGGTLSLSPRFQLRADVAPVLIGNNTVDRESGRPSRVLPFNAGVRFLVNPRIALDVFATNTFGNSGGPGLAAFSDNIGWGVSLASLPESVLSFIDVPGNRRFAESFNMDVPKERRRVYVPASFDLLDGSTIPGGSTRFALQASTGPISTAVRLGTLDDFELGFFANFAPAGVDESDGGTMTKIRFLHQPSGDPFTLSALFTLGRTSSRLCNFINGTRDGLERAVTGQPSACPGVPGVTPAGDRGPISPNLFGLVTENVGELIVLTLSLPAQYTFDNGASVWFNPKFAYIQRAGDRSPLLGASIGGSLPVFPGFEVVAQVTPIFRGDNAFVGDSLTRLLPWQAGVRFSPAGILGPVSLSLYATNSVGLSPYQSLRVRADNEVSVGLGLQMAF